MPPRRTMGGTAKQNALFVGRQSELALISRLLDGAKAGTGGFIGISGEPGIGKTRLAEAAAAAARTKGFGVFWGQCHDGQYIPPYWPWKEVLRGLLKMLPASRGKARQGRVREGLAEIVSEAFDVPNAPRMMPRPVSNRARLMILESTTDLIRTVSAHTPLLLIMDNLHCADVPSLQLLEVVARETRGQEVVIVGSYREPAADSPAAFRPTIGSLASQEFFHGVPLSGWDHAAVSDYLEACGIPQPPTGLVRAILDRTEGNPLFVGEVARLLEHEGLIDDGTAQDGHAWESLIPQKVRLAILGQVQRLSVPCRDAMSMAALAGREFEPRLLRLSGHMESADTQRVLEEAISHGIVAEDGTTAGLYKFTHALVQDVLVEHIPAPRRSVFHLRIGKALERLFEKNLETHSGELARHFDKAGPETARKAAAYYGMAGERALRMHGFDDAFAQLGRALQLEEGGVNGHETARLLFGLAQAKHGVGRFKDSIGDYTKAFALFEQGGDLDNAVRMLEQPLILAEKGVHAAGLFERAIALLGPETPRAEALGGKYGLAVYHDTGDYRRAVSIFEKALLSARQSGDRPQEMAALVNRGRIECDELHFEESHRLEQEAFRLADEDGDEWVKGMALASDLPSLLGLGRVADAERQARLLQACSARMQTRLWTTGPATQSFAVQRQIGNLAAAREINEKALALGRVPYRIWNVADRALLEFEQGNTAQGARFLRQARADAHLSEGEMPFHWEGWQAVLVSLITWVSGEAVAFEGAESAARELLAAGNLRKGDLVHIHAGLGLMSVIRRDAQAARKHYAEILPFRGLVLCPYQGITADHLLALLAGTMGDGAVAYGHFDAALTFCRGQGLALELAYTCRDYAQFLLEEGLAKEASHAAALCHEARAIALRCGLPRLGEKLEELQGRLAASGPAVFSHPDSLSDREVDVLRLLAQGLSNASIGGRLFISPYTVANHVQKILEKTGTANRTEAAMYAVRRGLLGKAESSP